MAEVLNKDISWIGDYKDYDQNEITVHIVSDNSSFSVVFLAAAKLGECATLCLGHFACVIDNAHSTIAL